MIIHHVRFNLKKDADLRAFRRGLKTLLTVPSVAAGWFGEPAKTAVRPVTETDWDLVLVLHFRTIKDHDAYQAHPIHERFIAECSPSWSRVRVVDTAL
jgi:hypothetical protein